MKYLAFATDYDGTIALHGLVDPATLDALCELKESGRALLLVTGREIPDLLSVFPEPGIFDLIVAENGALLYWPLTKNEKLLATPPPPEFAEMLRARAVNTLSVGRVIVATMESYESVVHESIRDLRLDLQVIPNKGALMILPRGMDKGIGLAAALQELAISAEATVAVGDAENDHALLGGAGFGVAVANALPALKSRAHWTTPSDHGAGVRELVQRLLS
jgi:hydroxymethylpyrimidine pyrophosphatase-like HAD family hydrolase